VVEAIREALRRSTKDSRLRHARRVLTGVETRTSSRYGFAEKTIIKVECRWALSCGRRRGIRRGIYSAAIDGIEVAEALALKMMAG